MLSAPTSAEPATSAPAPGSGHAADRLGVPVIGGSGRHHTVAVLTADGYQVIVF
jgi:hypothetical protein